MYVHGTGFPIRQQIEHNSEKSGWFYKYLHLALVGEISIGFRNSNPHSVLTGHIDLRHIDRRHIDPRHVDSGQVVSGRHVPPPPPGPTRNCQGPLRSVSSHQDPRGPVRTYQELLGPIKTYQDPSSPLWISQAHQDTSGSTRTTWDLSGPIKTLQDPSGPFRTCDTLQMLE